MDVWFYLQIVSAVVLGNGFAFAFFMAAMKCSKLQKEGAADDELPLWVYAGLMAAAAMVGLGFFLIP